MELCDERRDRATDRRVEHAGITLGVDGGGYLSPAVALATVTMMLQRTSPSTTPGTVPKGALTETIRSKSSFEEVL